MAHSSRHNHALHHMRETLRLQHRLLYIERVCASFFFFLKKKKNRKKSQKQKTNQKKKVAVRQTLVPTHCQRVPFAWQRYRISTAVRYTYV
jgi:hypothetical protein